MDLKLLVSVVLLLQLVDLGFVDAFWRLQCFGIVAEAQIDPIVSPGKISSHVHTVKGANGMLLESVAGCLADNSIYIPHCDSAPMSRQVCLYT